MKFLPKRRSPEDLGRRRPVPSSQGQGQVFSYYANRSANEMNLGRTSQEETPRRRESAFKKFIRRTPVVVTGVVVIITAVWQLSLSTSPKIVVLSTPGGDLFPQNTAAYYQAAATLFKKSLGNHNKLTVDATGISASLKKQFPELSDVSVALPVFGNRPVVYVQPSEPTFVLTATNGRYVLDSTGRAAASAGSVPKSVTTHLPAITDQSGLQPRTGAAVLPSTSISFMQTIVAQLRAQNFGVQQIVLPHAASEVDVYISGKPYFVKFNMQDSSGALQQVGSFIAVAQHLSSKNITPAHYIDVRIDGRAYYE